METDDELFSLAFKAMLLDKMNTAEYITSVERVDDTLVFGFKSANKVTIDLPKGEAGAPGESIQGERGLDGLNGKDGVDGRDGVDGQPGTDGRNGIDGVDGRDGIDGAPGKDGVDGRDGKEGKKGQSGTKGKDGSEGNGITDIYIDNKRHLIIVTRDKTFDAGKIKSGGGGGSGTVTEFRYTNSAPMPMSVGGFPEGTTFDNVSLQDLWTGLLYSNAGLPSFSEFDIVLLPPFLEVGESIEAGLYFAQWIIINPMLLVQDSIIISYVNDDLVLANNVPNVEEYEINLYEIFFDTPTVISFKIEAKNSLGNTLMKTFDIPVKNRIFVGESPLTILTEIEIKNLRFSELQDNINGDYVMSPGEYKWFCYPTSMGPRINFIDISTGLNVPVADPIIVNVTNNYGLTVACYCYRSYYVLNGSLTINIS